MKKLLLSFIIILPLLVFGILILKNQNTNPKKSGAENVSSSPTPTGNSIDLNFNNLPLKIYWYKITDIQKLKLIPNFSEKISSQESIDKNSCKFLVNGPFYTKDGFPTGLFISDGKTLAGWQQNSLFDGILSVNEMLTPRITRNVPQDNLIIAIQSGPILKENNSWQNLKIQNDQNARRVIAAVDGENQLTFIVVYAIDSNYLGPLLGNLPDVLKAFEEKTGITFADAINLDGGGASVFHTQDVNLSEINSPGAFFCQL